VGVLLLVFLASAVCIPAASAGRGDVTLTVRQVLSYNGNGNGNGNGSTPLPTDAFGYTLIPKQASSPMPSGSGANGYEFAIQGNRDASIGPIIFTDPGVYDYEINHTDDSQNGYTCDTEVYSLKVFVENDLSTTIIALKRDGSKAASIRYEHNLNYVYDVLPSNPYGVINPPVVKTVSGNPAKAETFEFRMEAARQDSPMPKGSSDGVNTLHIKGSGRGQFGTWAYTQEGVYYYKVSEVNTKAKGYTYDTTVYTITDTVWEENGQLEVTRVIKNDANKQVTSIAFINTYTGEGGNG